MALVAPARAVKPEDIRPFLEFGRMQGWQIKYETDIAERGFFAGDDAHRTSVLQQVLDDPQIDAIWVVRGGHGVSRIWPNLNWKGFQQHPKWIIGFSDATPLLWGAAYQGVVAIHGPVATQVPNKVHPDALDRLLCLLHGKSLPPLRWARLPWYAWRRGTAEGHLLGGNLSLLSTLAGTNLDYHHFDKPALLFGEEVGEYCYRLDRLLWHLRNAGWLRKAQGLIIGALSDLLDDEDRPFGQSLKEIVETVGADAAGPLVMGLPAGHILENSPLPVGPRAHLIVEEARATLTFEQAGA